MFIQKHTKTEYAKKETTFLKKSQVHNSKILRVMNAKFSGYFLYEPNLR